MEAAWTVANGQNGANVCLIIQPESGEVVGKGVCNSVSHPLKHAVMEAIAAVAAGSPPYASVDSAADGSGEPDAKKLCLRLECEAQENLGSSSDPSPSPATPATPPEPPYLCTGERSPPASMAAKQLVTVDIRPGNYAVLTIASEPVNSLSLPLWEAFMGALESLEANPAVRGVIIQSGLQRDVFTAGNDMKELYAPMTSEERYQRFWTVSNTAIARLHSSRLATVCAVRGACPAGGCVLAMACDARVMTDKGHIGLNEVALGIPVPRYWVSLMVRVVGHATAARLCTNAVVLPPQEALKVGLIDEITSKENLLQAAETRMKAMLKLNDVGRVPTKKTLNEDFAKEWIAFADREAHEGWARLASPAVVKALGQYMQMVSARSKSKM
ncbi:enoyl-CoA hydratase/isomerase [Helicosporidium sp. ATCC 50920]|nr:enoyl-CoA hydratase/isomerase [Helicosporidium sp. ATCC 50920]|eukprot:KDD76904.1 enoyl-CoA hydratase/isomerase [Helicosporidium sp. ATCC 50920]